MASINKEISSINLKISNKTIEIEHTEKKISQIRQELKSRLIHLYKNGKPSIIESILSAKDWNDAIYKTKYLNVLSEHEKSLLELLELGIALTSELNAEIPFVLMDATLK